MRVFSALVLALAAIGAMGQCQGDSYEDVHNALRNAYGRAGSGSGPWACTQRDQSMDCYGLNPYAYSTTASYTHNPRSLFVMSNHFYILTGIPNPGLPPTAPWMKDSDFSTSRSCLNFFSDILAEIRSNNPDPLPAIPTPAPIIVESPEFDPPFWNGPPSPRPTQSQTPPPNLGFNECTNSADAITYVNAEGVQKSTTCRALAEGKAQKMRQLCKTNSDIKSKCPGLCRTKDVCVCINNPWEFRVKPGKKMTCTELANVGETNERESVERENSKCSAQEFAKGPVPARRLLQNW